MRTFETTEKKSLRLKGFLTALVYILSQTILVFAVVIIVLTFTPVLEGQTPEDALMSKAGIISVVPALIAILIIIKINHKELKKRIIVNAKDYKTYIIPIIVVLSYILSLIIMGKITDAYYASIGGGEVITANEEAIQDSLEQGGRGLMIIYIVLLAPILEELVFRYGIIEFFDSFKMPKFLPYLFTAILFALIHETGIVTEFSIPNLFSFLAYLVPSLILSYMYMFSNKNIMALILAHILLNSISTLMS